MNRALYAGLSGTLANQTYIDVIGNNIANANTVGYKEGRVTFEDAFYQTLSGGRSGSVQGLGGQDPLQVGSGVSVGQVQTVQTQGALQSTSSDLDAAIEGNGMFVVSDGVNTFYTRDGSFALDSNHTLIAGSTGMTVLGWMAQNGVVNASGPMTALTFPLGQVWPGAATTSVQMAGNLDTGLSTGDTQSATVSVYDSLGNTHQVTLTFTKSATANAWDCTADLGGTTATTTLTFDPATGALQTGSPLQLSAPLTNGATSPLTFDLDLSDVTQLAQTGSSVLAASQDGQASSTLNDVELTDGGNLQGVFSDGHVAVLGTLAVATFGNVGGLVRTGSNLYETGANSGQVDVGAAGIANRGNVRARSLENSNVDLTRSFVEIMAAQRGYQASTRVISAANSMLDEVMRLNVS